MSGSPTARSTSSPSTRNTVKKLLELGRRGWAMMTVTPYGTSLDPPFNMPAGVATAQDGSIFAADGYGNRQVHRFSPEGELENLLGNLRPRAGSVRART